MAQHPWNNFTVPAILAQKGEASQTAIGICLGQIRHALDAIKLMRRAALEAIKKYDPSVHDKQIASLAWADLTEEEKQWVPPVFIVAKQSFMTSENVSSLNKALENEYPIKVLLLDDAAPQPENAAAEMLALSNVFYPFMANTHTFIGRGSLADPKDLFKCLLLGLKSKSGALLSVLCPQAFDHDINPKHWQALNALAVNTRAFNSFQYNPVREGSSFGMKIKTKALPNTNSVWKEVSLKKTVDEEEVEFAYKPTWADWALTILDWKNEFKKVERGEDTVALSEFLELSVEQKANKTPVIVRIGEANEVVEYKVS